MPLLVSFGEPGNYTIDDNDTPGDNTSVIRDSTGAVALTFGHPADLLKFTVSTTDINLAFNFTDSLGAANFTIGEIADLAQSPASIVAERVSTTGIVTLVSNGAISEGAEPDAGTDITAGTLIMSAATGIGTPGNAIELQVGVIEAETNSGGINLVNVGTVQIGGGASADVDGLSVANVGDINFTNAGTILLSEDTGTDSVHGAATSGNVTLVANGFDADIIANVDRDTITAAGGAINLTASRDIAFGTIGTNFDNDVRASGGVTINAGRDFLIDGFADLASDSFGQNTGGDVVINAGRNISVLSAAGADASIFASGSAGADVILTTGAGGTLTVNPSSAAIGSSSGNVVVNADRMLIAPTGGISATAGQVFLRGASAGRTIDVGSATDAAVALELSDAELDRIFAPSLTIGSSVAGSLTLSAAISPANVTDLTLQSGEDVTMFGGVTIAGVLTVKAGDNLFLAGAATITAASFAGFVDQDGAADAAGGVGTLNGVISGVSSLTGNVNADRLTGNAGNNLLNGAGGADVLRGLGGDDTYFVDIAGDVVEEGVGLGAADEVRASVSYTLGAGVEVESLMTTNNGGTGAINLTGNEFANTVFGNAGANILNGAGGADTMTGLGGDDRFFVDDPGDVVVEGAGGGTADRVLASVTYTLGAGVEVEILSTTNNGGAGAIDLTGNEFANSIFGNAGANSLDGAGGVDTLTGFGGNDLFFVDNAGDVVVEGAGGGTADRVLAGVNYTLGNGVQVEILSTTDDGGTGAINLSGNEFVNTVVGNDGINILNGRGGADTMTGLGGSDRFFVDDIADVVNETAGGGTADLVQASVSYALAAGTEVEILRTNNSAGTSAINLTGNEFANTVQGNAGNNILDGRGGSDVLDGLGGSDTFRFKTAPGAGNIDTISNYSVADDGIQLENAVFTGLAAGALAASAFFIGAAAHDADDRVIYDSATGALFFDADGNGAGAAAQFAILSTGLAMASTEFIVI